MTRTRFKTAVRATLGLGFAIAIPISASAQVGPGLSSGSGSGTGTGYSSGVQNNTSGSVSGVGPGPASRPGSIEGIPRLRPGDMNSLPPGFSVPFGPGVDTRFPDDTTLFPFVPETEGASAKYPSELARITAKDLERVAQINDPAEKTLTYQRIGAVSIFTNQLGIAHQALGLAADSAFQIPDPLIRDLRIMSIIYTLDHLSEAHLREGKADQATPPPPQGDEPPAPIPTPTPGATDRVTLINRAEVEWRRAAYLASRMSNPTYSNEMLYRVVDSQSFGSQSVVNEFPRDDAAEGAPKDGKPSSSQAVLKRADELLVKAAEIAATIKRPVWRDRALVAVAHAAALSRQFPRGVEIAMRIPQPEVRTDALVRIAEAQARAKDAGATRTYQLAAEAVASIPLEDPRAVLTGVLIDNLISVGRFEDARSTVSLYKDEYRQYKALGSIAESQGFRGAAESALAWIQKEVPQDHQPALIRRVRFGVLQAVEQNRNRDLSTNRGAGTGE